MYGVTITDYLDSLHRCELTRLHMVNFVSRDVGLLLEL